MLLLLKEGKRAKEVQASPTVLKEIFGAYSDAPTDVPQKRLPYWLPTKKA